MVTDATSKTIAPAALFAVFPHDQGVFDGLMSKGAIAYDVERDGVYG